MTINEFIRKYRVVKTKDYNGTKFADLWEDGISVNVFNPYVICNDCLLYTSPSPRDS